MPEHQAQFKPEDIDRLLDQLAQNIRNKHKLLDRICFIGILENGVPLANRLAKRLSTDDLKIPVGSIDPNIYRDDIYQNPYVTIRENDLPFNINKKIIILIDDIIFTGRTVRATLDAILDHGRPDKIELAVLIDRGHREVPIQPDYIGKTAPTHRTDNIQINLVEITGEDNIFFK